MVIAFEMKHLFFTIIIIKFLINTLPLIDLFNYFIIILKTSIKHATRFTPRQSHCAVQATPASIHTSLDALCSDHKNTSSAPRALNQALDIPQPPTPLLYNPDSNPDRVPSGNDLR